MCSCLLSSGTLTSSSAPPIPRPRSVPDKGSVLLSAHPILSTKSFPMSRPKGQGFWLRERGEEAWLKPAGLKAQTGEQSVHFPYLEVDSGVADGLDQPGACCPGNSPAPPLLIGRHGGSQPRIKGTPVIALLKTYQSHCGWRNKRSFSSSPCLFLPRKGGGGQPCSWGPCNK